MRKVFTSFFLALIILAGPVAAQQHGWGFNTGADPAYVLPQTSSLTGQFTTAPVAVRKTLINTTINEMAVCGLWDRLDFLYMLAAADSQAARLNWKSAGNNTLIVNGAPTFTTDRGYTGTGNLANYLDTSFLETTGIQSQNDRHLGVYVLSSIALSGASDAGSARVNMNSSSGTSNLVVQMSTNAASNTAVSSSLGFSLSQRDNSANYTVSKNAAARSTVVQASLVSTAFPYFILANNQTNGLPISPTTRQIAMVMAGRSLSVPQELCAYNAILRYLQGVGAQ